MLDYKVKIGEVTFPNKMVSCAETTSNLTNQGYKTNVVPIFRMRFIDEPESNYKQLVEAFKSGETISIVDDNNTVVGVFSDYPVFGTCDRVLETSGFNISVTMYAAEILDLENGSSTMEG